MYTLKITYDTGDSFHHEDGLEQDIKMTWKDVNKAKKALKEIEKHYHYYMILHQEWNAGKEEREKAQKDAEKQPWYAKEYPEFNLLLENDNGERVSEHIFWTGYFETLVGIDVVELEPENDGMSCRISHYK